MPREAPETPPRDQPRNSLRSHPLLCGRYRVLGPLGQGGMASVWSVNDEVTGRDLALKRLTANAAAAHVALFEREYHTLATLNHPCIVRAFDYAADDQGPFYTMELLLGSDSSSRAPLPYTEVCRMLRDLAEAIGLLHARRLIHRDLSARNVWMMPDGTIKLIDFGAMTTFGKAEDVAGTPPFIAPESLHGLHVDQPTDLYALGALGYYLLTGRHAFPARTLIELTSMWAERPLPVSKRVAELGRADLPAVPAALEALIDGLLSHDPLARPTTAAEVISRLTTIAALPETHDRQIAESYLTSPAFVGRSAERAILRDTCAAAGKGEAGANTILVQSPVGLGRSRLLSELSLELSVSGVTVLHAEPDADRATHSAAQKYAWELLNALHDKGLRAAGPYASTLGHLSPALRDRLGVERLADMPSAHGEARMRVQTALRDWFLAVAREHTLIIIADDFDRFDEASAAWLVGLAHAAQGHKLRVIAAVTSGAEVEAPATKALRRHARVVSLAPLSLAEMQSLFRSVFGDAQHLDRLVDVVQQRSEGNPGLALDLAEHLTRDGVVALEEGAWILPQSVPATALPSSRLAAELARLERLPAAARQLGQALSVRSGSLSLAMCARLAEIDGHALFAALEALAREGVLIGADNGYRFTRESIREHLYAELNAERKRRAHRRLGQFLLQLGGSSALEQLYGGVHLLLGDDDEAGSVAVAAAGRNYGLVQLADLGPATAALETALEHLRARGRPRHELVLLLAPLALGGYYADRRLALRYGWEAVDALQHVVGLHRARTLRPLLGRKLSLIIGLAGAAIALALKRRNLRVPSFREAMMLLFNCVAALTGVCTICLDAEAGMRYASVIEPMTALGPKHVASFMHRFCLNLVATISDDQARACEQWRELIAQLDDPAAPSHLPANVHALYLGGALYARGAIECYRDESHAVECAERLDALQLKLYDMSADQIRLSYYANRGNREQFEHFRQRVEMHAIQRGTAWQVETWKQHALLTVYLRTGDVAGLKECVQQLKRSCVEMPSFEKRSRPRPSSS
jgi:serine/threonine protein kinase